MKLNALALSLVMLMTASDAFAGPKNQRGRYRGVNGHQTINQLEQRENALRAEVDRLEHLQDVADKRGGPRADYIKDRLEQRQDRLGDQIELINKRQDQIRNRLDAKWDRPRNWIGPRYNNYYGNYNPRHGHPKHGHPKYGHPKHGHHHGHNHGHHPRGQHYSSPSAWNYILSGPRNNAYYPYATDYRWGRR